MKRTVVAGLLVVAMLSIPDQSFTSVSRYLSLQELCFHSDTIVEAKVVSINSFYHGEKKPKIYTSIKLEIVQTYTGECKQNDIIELVRYGGTIGDKSTFQLDEPVFLKDQISVLFLKSYTSEFWGQNYQVYGLSEGKFNIRDGKIYRDNTNGLLNLSRKGSLIPISNKTGMNKDIFIGHINSFTQ